MSAAQWRLFRLDLNVLNVPICTQGIQRTWWSEAGTIIVTGPYSAANNGLCKWENANIWREMRQDHNLAFSQVK